MSRDLEEKDLAFYMQDKCIHCKKEHYAPAVYLLSTEGGECGNCGGEIYPMTKSDYLKALKWYLYYPAKESLKK